MGNVLLCAGLLALAATVPAPTVVTEEQVIDQLGQGHPALVAQQAHVAEAEADRVRAGQLNNPVLVWDHEAPRDAMEQTTWGVAWAPRLDGRRSLRLEAAAEAVRATEGGVATQRMEIREAARAAFTEWWAAHARRQALEEHLAVVTAVEAHMRQRAASGEEPGLEARRLTLATDEARAQLAIAAAEEAKAMAALRAWFPGLPADARPERPGLPPVLSDVDASARGDLKALGAAKARSEIELRLAERVFSPPEFMVGWQTQELPGATYSGPVFSLSIAVPVFDYRQADRALARAQTARTEAELAALNLQAEAEVEGALAAYARLAREAVEQERGAAGLPAMTDAATLAYRLGETSLTDFLDTLRAALAAKIRIIDLLVLALESHRGLELAAGRPVPTGGEK